MEPKIIEAFQQLSQQPFDKTLMVLAFVTAALLLEGLTSHWIQVAGFEGHRLRTVRAVIGIALLGAAFYFAFAFLAFSS